MIDIPEPIWEPDGDDVLQLAAVMQTVLREMHEGNIKASPTYMALCVRAYEPFRTLLGDDGLDYMSISDALHLCREADLQTDLDARWQRHLAGQSLGYKIKAQTLEDGTAEICMWERKYQKALGKPVWAAVLPPKSNVKT